jgi:hypothetical protein
MSDGTYWLDIDWFFSVARYWNTGSLSFVTSPANNKTYPKLSKQQCAALRTVFAREAQFGTCPYQKLHLVSQDDRKRKHA